MVKVFTTNSSGKIEFTKEELEKLLNEIWHDGYNSNTSYWWSSPGRWWSQPEVSKTPITISCGSDSITTTDSTVGL